MGEGKENGKRRMRDAPQLEEVPLCGKKSERQGEEHSIICMDGLKREAYPSN